MCHGAITIHRQILLTGTRQVHGPSSAVADIHRQQGHQRADLQDLDHDLSRSDSAEMTRDEERQNLAAV